MTAKKTTKPALGIEPSKMTVPAMDRPSIAFAWFLETMIVEDHGERLTMACSLCVEDVCSVEAGDTLRALLNTALAHNCDGS